jgi:hypothetical protein
MGNCESSVEIKEDEIVIGEVIETQTVRMDQIFVLLTLGVINQDVWDTIPEDFDFINKVMLYKQITKLQ